MKLPTTAAAVAFAALAVAGVTAATSIGTPPYDRVEFGNDWTRIGPGCDTRDLVLARDLDPDQWRGCDVIGGTLHDPYTGAVVTGPSRDFDVDHVVPLAWAWRHGAWRWTPARRVAFANDPAELRATTPRANRSKGDAGLDEWLPQVNPCAYAQQFDAVADRYHLDDPARDGQVAHACGGP